ncbi:hypothetical protein NQ317_011879, partial [Molorchus minor]
MKLPDDKNPKIVWDQDKKRWTNVDEDPNDTTHEFKPPPKMSDIMPKMAQNTQPMPGAVQNAPIPTFNSVSSVVPQGNVLAYDLGQTSDQPVGPLSLPNAIPGGSGAGEDAGNVTKMSQPNMFKLQRGRTIEKPSAAMPQMNFFVPQSTSDPNAPIDFLTPGGVLQFGEQ